MELNNITILIAGLIGISIVGLIYKNELIVTTVVGGLIGYLSKDVNIQVTDAEKTEDVIKLEDANEDEASDVDDTT